VYCHTASTTTIGACGSIPSKTSHVISISWMDDMDSSSKGSTRRRRFVVVEAVWQYTHHILSGLVNHRGPILTVANWSGSGRGWWNAEPETAAC